MEDPMHKSGSLPHPAVSAEMKGGAPKNEITHLDYALIGAISGTVMESTVHPIDTVRTRIKSNSEEFVSFISQSKKMYKAEGINSYFRGFTATLFGAFLSQGVYFYIYEKLKHIFKTNQTVSQDVGPFIAGFVGGFIGDLIEIPCDLIRTRMQLEPGHYDYKHIFDGMYKIYTREGFTKLYLGGTAYCTLDAIDTSLTFGFYELFHRLLRPYMPSKEGEMNLPLSLSSSAIAASVTAIISNPLDVLVTRVQMVNTAKQKQLPIRKLIKNIYKKEGIEGFFKGVTGRTGHFGLSAVILFPTYEFLKIKFGVDLSD